MNKIQYLWISCIKTLTDTFNLISKTLVFDVCMQSKKYDQNISEWICEVFHETEFVENFLKLSEEFGITENW